MIDLSNSRKVKTDVLIIGAGGAGIMAAVQAKENGCEVFITSKGHLRSNITNTAKGGFSACIGDEDSPELFLKDTLAVGADLNIVGLAEAMCKDSVEITNKLIDWGYQPNKHEGFIDLKYSNLHSVPRIVHSKDKTGYHLMTSLLNKISNIGIYIEQNIMFMNLIEKNGYIAGAFGFNWRTGEFIEVSANVVILAAGGSGQLYDFTDNSPLSTGDGVGMAYRVGAKLVDMEMIEFQLAIVYPEKIRRTPANTAGFFSKGARLYNVKGERVMRRYFPDNLEKSTRTEVIRVFGLEKEADRTTERGGLFIDCSDVLDAVKERSPNVCQVAFKAGVDLSFQPLEVAPGAHNFLGGILIDKDCSTNIPGLLAAGECSGGIHGANRLGGNALTDALVFGVRAGNKASAMSMKPHDESLSSEIIGIKKMLEGVLERQSGELPDSMRKEIQKEMSENAFVVRNEANLIKANKRLENLKYGVKKNTFLGNNKKYLSINLRKHIENINLIDVGLSVIRSSLFRRESRGAHYRSDFNKTIDEYTGNIIQYRKNGGDAVEFMK